MAFDFNKVDSFTIDVLKEISTIGAGNAATALAKMVSRRINMKVPSPKILNFNEVGRIMGNEDDVVAAVFIQLTGSISGVLLFILDFEDALSIIRILTKREYATLESLDEIATSAICETGSIMAGVYMSALTSMTNLDVRCQYPQVIIDMAGAILSLPAIAMAEVAENILYIDTGFEDGTETIKAKILMVPDGNSFSTLLKSLGVG